MVAINVGAKGHDAEVSVAQAEAPKFEKVIWYKEQNLRKLYFWVFILMIASATTGYDGSLMGASQNFNKWKLYFNNPEGSRLGLMNAGYQIGSVISFPFVPTICDRWGRKPSIEVGCVIMIAGAFVGAFCHSYKVYVVGRALMGFGNSFAQLASPTLLTEIAHPQHRAVLPAIYNCLWNLGSVVCNIIGLGLTWVHSDWNWRTLTLIQAFPSIIQLTFIWWVPESPRWLIAKERDDEALQTLAYYHANGDASNTTVQFEYREIRETIALEVDAQRNTSYLDFFKTKGNRYRLFILITLGIISQYSGNALFSNYQNTIYESAGITSQRSRLGLGIGQTGIALITSIVASSQCERFGRRPLFLWGTAGMAVCFLCYTISTARYEASSFKTIHIAGEDLKVHSNQPAGNVQIFFIWVYGIFYAFCWSGLLVCYSLEVLPYRLRAKGLMIMNMTVQAILAMANETNPIAFDSFPHLWNFELFYTLWICVEFAIVYFFYIETKGTTLEEVARIFDGEDAVAHLDLAQVEKEGINRPPSERSADVQQHERPVV